MNLYAVKDDASYRRALGDIERVWGAKLGSPEGDFIDAMATLVEAYEEKHYAVPAADPVDMLHFAIEDMGRSQAELGKLLGSRPRASEILNRRRFMTIDQIRLISEAWHLPIATLTGAYELQRELVPA